MTVQYLSKVFSSIHTLFLLTLFVILRYEEKSFQMKTNHRFFFRQMKWCSKHFCHFLNQIQKTTIKFRQSVKIFVKVLTFEFTQFKAGSLRLWEKTLVSQCANWFDIWWILLLLCCNKLNREPVCSFFKDFPISFRVDMW